METRSLDLSQYRCPMSLLLAKRASKSLAKNEMLRIKVIDKGSLTDMMSYFEQYLFDIQLEHTDICSLLTIKKK